ncbi:dihydroneopterin aldolase [Tepidamorphus gemmatus]|jgi:dihydroneopterin aldolase|uniref:7,8-dihydroneopterin aldolase n=1 Tax=Tepidamorphus gemmatus TaxID=747076 RepID=A0A4R3M4Y1_9HYPH|nr:dihydroneopterin aldolase [Tepidamorphus gemmatus]TCT08330.1 dihydroneopterin aldolase [Tepidamorphus gemmatus]
MRDRRRDGGDRVFFRGIVLFARHGVKAEEERLGQRFEIDLDCHLDLAPAGSTDDVTLTIDYGEVYTLVRDIVEGERFYLIEALAERIAGGLLARFARIDDVRVEIRKPAAPVAGVFDTVGVEIIRRRQ